MTKLPQRLTGVRSAVGTELPDAHLIIRALQRDKRLGQDFVGWIDERYARVFSDPRLTISEPQLAKLSKRLADPNSFADADAEVQLAATVLADSDTRIGFVEASSSPAVRTPDFKIHCGREIEAEVRIVRESDEERETHRVERSIMTRLQACNLGVGCRISIRIQRVRDADSKFVFDAGAEKRLVKQVEKVVRTGVPADGLVVGLEATGTVTTEHRRRKTDLAAVEIAPSNLPRPIVMGFSGLHVPSEEARVVRALQKKGTRKQRTAGTPWVIVLDGTNSTLTELEEISNGARCYFRNSQSISAAVFQRWTYGPAGWGVRADERWYAKMESRAFANPNAALPLTDRELAIFNWTEVRWL